METLHTHTAGHTCARPPTRTRHGGGAYPTRGGPEEKSWSIRSAAEPSAGASSGCSSA